jgi:hypothetical protein
MQAKPPIAGGGISGAVVDLVGVDRGKKNAPPNWQGRTGRILRGGGLRSPSCAVTAARYEGPRGAAMALSQTAAVRLQRFHRVP